MRTVKLYKTPTGKIHLSLNYESAYECGMGRATADKKISVNGKVVTCKTCKNIIKKIVEAYMRIIK